MDFLKDVPMRLVELEKDGLVRLSANSCEITDAGRTFLRNTCMAFDARLVERLVARARGAGATEVVCTGKDWVKLRLLPLPPALTIVRPQLSIEFVEGCAPLRRSLSDALARGDRRLGR